MVVDGRIVITGSFNFTKAAEESNAENLLVIRDAELAGKYTANWDVHLKHSERYQGRLSTPAENRSDASPAGSPAGYAGSKRSEVFHRASCASVAKIAEHNLVHYASRDEAVKAGKRPCAICKPSTVDRRLRQVKASVSRASSGWAASRRLSRSGLSWS